MRHGQKDLRDILRKALLAALTEDEDVPPEPAAPYRVAAMDFSFLTFEEMVQSRMIPVGSRLHILSLRSFKQSIADEWTLLAKKITLAAENTISRHPDAKDRCSLESDDTYIFIFSRAADDEAEEKVREITGHLMRRRRWNGSSAASAATCCCDSAAPGRTWRRSRRSGRWPSAPPGRSRGCRRRPAGPISGASTRPAGWRPLWSTATGCCAGAPSARSARRRRMSSCCRASGSAATARCPRRPPAPRDRPPAGPRVPPGAERRQEPPGARAAAVRAFRNSMIAARTAGSRWR